MDFCKLLQKMNNTLIKCHKHVEDYIAADHLPGRLELNKLCNEIPQNTLQIFEVLDSVMKVYDSSKELYFLMINYNLNDLGEDVRLDIMEILGELEDKYCSMDREFNDLLQVHLHRWSDKISQEDIGFEKIQQLFRKFPDSVKLYVDIAQKLVNKNYEKDRQTAFKIINAVEKDKTFILGQSGIDTEDQKFHKKLQNPWLKSFNLMPSSTTVPLEELTKKIFGIQHGFTKEEQLKDIAKNNICIIVQKNIVRKPVEFDLSKLNMDEYKSSRFRGVDEKIVDKLRIMYFKGDRELKTKWDVAVYGDLDKAADFYILETIDGKNYRPLTPWITGKNFALPRYRISSLINFLKEHRYDDRVYTYHELQARNILRNMFLDKPVDMDKIKDTSIMQVDAGQLRNNIHIKPMELFRKSKINSLDQLYEFIHDRNSQQIGFIFSNVIMEHLRQHKKNLENNHDFREALSSYVSDLDRMRIRYNRELFDRIKASQESNVQKRFEDALQHSLLSLIRNDHNIYNQFIFKLNLLKYSRGERI